MTDKEIRTSRGEVIINGIDVSRCEYRDWQNSCHCDNSKENEGEKRVTGRGGCKYNPNCYFKQLKRKEKECEKVCKAFDIEYVIDKETGEIIYRSNKILQYKQALDEIEEIAKCNNFLIRDPFCGTGYRDLSGQILNIIKSAKDGE